MDQPRKLCAARSCDEIAEMGEALCLEHGEAQRAASNQRKAQAKLSVVAREGAAFYKSERWHRLREMHLAMHPLCADCRELGQLRAAREVDHITPHRGDPRLMWRASNLQSLCRSCHSRKTAREVWHGGSPKP